MRTLAIALVLAACGSDPVGPEFPAPGELPIVEAPPDPFTTFTGRSITTPAEWETIRKPELERLFGYYVYGFAPEPPGNTTVREVARASLTGGVDYREYEVHYGPAEAPPLYLAVFAPAAATGPVPVFLTLNACGNHTVTPAPEVRMSTAWIENACVPDRGSQAARFPVEQIVAGGVALATFHQSDVDPDDAAGELSDGVHAYFTVDETPETQWGTLAAWSFGMSRAIDALEQLPHVDASRVATVGHSRRGKVALLTAAQDPRVSIAIPHQSGTAGATLTRSDLGESVFAITAFFPHWFGDHFVAFASEERQLPIDQHLLIAMVAPRPVLVTNGADDSWADPPGARRSVELADPVYKLLGARGIVDDGAGGFDFGGELAWHVRDGGHSLEARDWTTFLAFAARHW